MFRGAVLLVIFSGSTYKDNLEPDQISGGLSTVTQGKHNVSTLLEEYLKRGMTVNATITVLFNYRLHLHFTLIYST
jgi:uncharacterized membrane protein YciS (DUF1049 family)